MVCSINADTLTVEQAVMTALENNYGIRIAQRTTDRLRHDSLLIPGNFLPRVNARAGADYSYGRDDGAARRGGASTVSAGIQLDWTLFDGFEMFYARDAIRYRIASQEERSRQEVEQTVLQVYSRYYECVNALHSREIVRRQKELTADQLAKLRADYEYGTVSHLDVLNLQVRLNTDMSQLAQAELDVVTAQNNLNISLGNPPNTPISVVRDTSVPAPGKSAEYWKDRAFENNRQLHMLSLSRQIQKTAENIARARLWPTFSLSSSHTEYGGTERYSRFSAGVQLNMPVIDGNSRRRDIRRAADDSGIARLEEERKKIILEGTIYELWATYVAAFEQVRFEEDALEAARENRTLSREYFEAGTLSELAYRESQMEYLHTEFRLAAARYQCRILSLQLKHLAGVAFF
jgi:outer membrane protein TolC